MFWIILIPIIGTALSLAAKLDSFHGFWAFFLAMATSLGILALIIWTIGFIYRLFRSSKATQKVLLEGIPFLRKWRVYTDDQVNARYILTPVLMEKMLKIKKLFHGNFIDFCFSGSSLLIAVHTGKDLFETASF